MLKGKKIKYSAVFIGLLIIAMMLLGLHDTVLVLQWWCVSFILGIGLLPLSRKLMGWMADEGYLASKVLTLLISGWVNWLICYVGIQFISLVSWAVLILVSAAAWSSAIHFSGKKPQRYVSEIASSVIGNSMVWLEEVIYFGMFVFWLYVIGFRPEAFGTERLMDYGFMATMIRSRAVPAVDMWYSDGILNYYYGGQYYVVYLIRLCMTELRFAYNLFRAMLPALSFVLAFDMILTLFNRTYKKEEGKGNNKLQYLAGVLGGAALTFAGNGHFILFYKIIPMLQELVGVDEVKRYWFSDSTRYIGYWPDVEDKTIHEYPAYSFLLGDMHAHVINLMFILLFLIILMGWCFRQNPVPGKSRVKANAKSILVAILQPEIIMMSFLVGIFKWTNFWDFAIYFGLAGLVLLAMNIRNYQRQPWTVVVLTALEAVEALIISEIVTLPFTLDFDSMFQGVATVENNSRFYQLVILWGIPVITVIIYTIFAYITESEEFETTTRKIRFTWLHLDLTTIVTVIMGLYGIVLIIIPEILYVKDIYGVGHSRSNTMFKFTYQAFILFALVMSYALMRMVAEAKKNTFVKKCATVLMILLICTVGYLPAGIKLWFGDITKVSQYRGSDATRYIATELPGDESAIHWLDQNVKDSVVVLEADGNSYSNYNIVSGVTGLPTVLGWYTHERLWRNDNTDDLNVRAADVRTIYTSTDIEQVKELLQKYHVAYIFVGSKEWEKYEDVQTDTFDQIGEVVYTAEALEDAPATCIYKIYY